MKYIPKGATRLIGAVALYGHKNAPQLLFAGGIVGVVATTVLSSRATLRLEETVEKTQETLDAVRAHERPDYTEHDRKKDTAVVYTKGVMAVGKLYAPSIILGTVSIAMLTKSHQILTSRNAALTVAYNGLHAAMMQYRKRVVDEFGEDKDREFMYGSQERTIVEDTKDGPKKVQIKTYDGAHSPYAVLFHRGNRNYNPTPEYNLQFLRGVQNHLNDRLHAYGHVMLNDAYDELGVDRTPAGTQVGWLRNGPNSDGYIDFGIFKDKNMLQVHDFLTGREGELLLDFNVDGVIWDQINNLQFTRGGVR